MKVVTLIGALAFQHPAVTDDRGILPLTAERLADARAVGETTDAPHKLLTFSVLGMVRMAAIDRAGQYEAHDIQRVTDAREAPFVVSISSPYVRAVEAVHAVTRRFEASPQLDIAALNAGKVIVLVTSGVKFPPGDLIENVIIKREGETVRPLTRVVKDTIERNSLGASAPGAEGAFTFDFATFVPTTAITIVLIGKRGNFEWDVTKDELALLK